MDLADDIEDLANAVQTKSENVFAFLSGSKEVSDEFQKSCAGLYKSGKKLRLKNIEADPLPVLHVSGFDSEQIWQQIELFNKTEWSDITTIFKEINVTDDLMFFKENSQAIDNKDDEDLATVESEENESDGDEKDPDLIDDLSAEEDFGYSSEEEKQDNDFSEENFEKTEVDDDFFSIRQMEKFLVDKEHKEELLNGKSDLNMGDEINYFDDIESDAEEGDVDLFSTGENFSSVARNMKYHDYYVSKPKPRARNIEPVEEDELENPIKEKLEDVKGNTDVQDKLLKIANLGAETQSKFTQLQGNLESKIKTLERQYLLPPSWQMKGETTAQEREKNALLEEDLEFDVVSRPAPELTDEYTMSLEDVIKQRIVDQTWDDVERKSKPKNISEYKKRIDLDSSKSKLSLGEVYEQEYQKQIAKDTGEVEEKEDEDHTAIKESLKTLFLKLDALSNYHFNASIPEPEVKILPLVPSIQIEEVQPVAHSVTQRLAPEEIFDKKRNDNIKDDKEKTQTDKKRERRKKKIHKKAAAKARLIKELSKDSTSNKAQTLLAMKKLKTASKTASSRTTIIKEKTNHKDLNLTSSKDFFTKLQETK